MGYSPVQFFCGCSKEMFCGMLQSLSGAELKQANKEVIDTYCQICGRTYRFTYTDIQGLMNERKG
ncbi:Hsp33 family molecular chaperone HslO [Cytobacillus firmus]|uniref:Hsp33 family molecular chaperone HslO n=1 Tax=Cytobacillus firmus TaxID=1399 RepID=UPI0037C160ED